MTSDCGRAGAVGRRGSTSALVVQILASGFASELKPELGDLSGLLLRGPSAPSHASACRWTADTWDATHDQGPYRAGGRSAMIQV